LKFHSLRLARHAAVAALVVLASLASAAPAVAEHEGTPSGASLVPEKASVTIPESIKLTANADRHLYGTGYTVAVIDDDSGIEIGAACAQTPCMKYGTTSWADNGDPQDRHFHAELRGPGGNTVASSGQVTVGVDKHVWNVLSVVANPEARVVPGSIQFFATLDHTTSGSPYSIYIYDEDDTASPPTICNQYVCTRSVSRSWADNANPKSGHVRVEVRSSSGDVASSTAYADAQFRRFIFTPTLSFSTKTWPDGHVDQVASARMASTDPSFSGTGYQIKIRKADGTQLCSAAQFGCDATVTVGGTYRAVVEDSQGRNFGDSGSWTLTSSGAQSDFVDGVDLALLAQQVTPDDICLVALTSGGPSANETSPPDSYEACELMRGRGATALEILRDIVTVGGGLLVLHMLDANQMAPQFDPGSEPDDWETMIAAPLPAPQQSREDKLADRLQVLNQGLSATEANAVARQCRFLLGKRGLNGDAECQSYPIFASGSDVEAATKHDLAALKSWLPWTLLNYDGRGETKPGDRWYRSVDPCDQPYDGLVWNCHEFPFFSTLQGGSSPVGGRDPFIDVINAADNQNQGSYLTNRFYRKCGISGRTDDPEFLNLPVSPVGPVPTLGLCNGFN
jgi:hypothetical protein